MLKKHFLLALVIFFIAAVSLGAQQAVTFSFASDDNHAGKNFYCDILNPQTIKAMQVPVDLMVDRNDIAFGGIVTIQSFMELEARITAYNCVAFAGQFLHMWSMEGFIRFRHIDGPPPMPILRIDFDNAVLTSFSPTATDAGETLTLQVSESVDNGMLMTPMTLLPGIGVNAGDLIIYEDLGITFTNITTGHGTLLIPLTAAGDFNDDWKSEGSFSASGCQG